MITFTLTPLILRNLVSAKNGGETQIILVACSPFSKQTPFVAENEECAKLSYALKISLDND